MSHGVAIFRLTIVIGLLAAAARAGEEPPALNPFGPQPPAREDSLPGCVEMSDGAVLAGRLYLTRDALLQIYDGQLERQREVPLRVVRRIDGQVEKEWLEREWRFKENANDEKVYTGRSYPARLYSYTITLKDGRKISGPLSGILYVDEGGGRKPRKLLLHKRDKGAAGDELASLVYVRSVELGEEALRRGQARGQTPPSPGGESSVKRPGP